jgi:hypothetical protein
MELLGQIGHTEPDLNLPGGTRRPNSRLGRTPVTKTGRSRFQLRRSRKNLALQHGTGLIL